MTLAPLAAAQIVARNVVPLAGILWLGWSAANTLLLYFLDTVLAMTVILAGLMSVFARHEEQAAARMTSEISAVLLGACVACILAVPLAVPLVFVLAPSGFSWRETVADPQLRIAALMQVVAAGWSYVDLWRALRTETPEALALRRRFALVFLRWMAVLVVVYTGVPVLLGPLVVVAAYAAVSIWAELFPDHFLRTMPGGAEDAGVTGTPGAHVLAPAKRSRRRRRRS